MYFIVRVWVTVVVDFLKFPPQFSYAALTKLFPLNIPLVLTCDVCGMIHAVGGGWMATG